MTVHYRIDHESHRILTRAFGEVTLEEVLEHFDQLAADPSYERDLDVLLDLVDCKTLPEADEIRAAAERVTAEALDLRFGRLAVVVSSEALFGMARMFLTLGESAFSDAQVFRDRDDALAWLGGFGPAG
jgi:NAD(P)-dependent dehydrogenase (short-subunit alcohol dehydrogenase family)